MTTDAALYRLMTWLSPAYPVGAYSYSHGIEYAVEAGLVRDRDTLADWIAQAVRHGAGLTDAALLAAAWRVSSSPSPPPGAERVGVRWGMARNEPTSPSHRFSDGPLPLPPLGGEGIEGDLDSICALADAWRGSAEMALESRTQGAAFLMATRAAWPHPALDEFALRWRGDAVLPVIVGVAAAAHGIALEPALIAYLHGFASNLVSAGVRLIPLGQTDGQRAIAALEPAIAATTFAAVHTPLDEIGTAAPMIDWCSMRHETQYTRLFRS
ncbi:MAG TPA: urease accessory protein UreF [Stellaceae bacterium]